MISRRLAPESTLGDREVVVFSVEYAPGAACTRHRHPGPVFVYVARGAVVSSSTRCRPGHL